MFGYVAIGGGAAIGNGEQLLPNTLLKGRALWAKGRRRAGVLAFEITRKPCFGFHKEGQVGGFFQHNALWMLDALALEKQTRKGFAITFEMEWA